MISVSEFKASQCNTEEWWRRHNLHEPVEIDGQMQYYTVESAVALLNLLNPDKTITEWEVS